TTDYYFRLTSDLLYPVALPGLYTGYYAQWRNAASISNEGLELLISFEPIRRKDLFWKMSFNIARNWNRFEASYNNKDIERQTINAKPNNGIYGYLTEGYFNLQQEVPISYNAAGISKYLGDAFYNTSYYTPGDYRFKDVNNDGYLTYEDMVYLASALPVASG